MNAAYMDVSPIMAVFGITSAHDLSIELVYMAPQVDTLYEKKKRRELSRALGGGRYPPSPI